MRRELMRHVARLAALEIAVEDEEDLARELGRVVEWVDALPEIAAPGDGSDPETESEAREEPPRLSRRDLLDQAPERRGDWYVVPAIRPEPADER